MYVWLVTCFDCYHTTERMLSVHRSGLVGPCCTFFISLALICYLVKVRKGSLLRLRFFIRVKFIQWCDNNRIGWVSNMPDNVKQFTFIHLLLFLWGDDVTNDRPHSNGGYHEHKGCNSANWIIRMCWRHNILQLWSSNFSWWSGKHDATSPLVMC